MQDNQVNSKRERLVSEALSLFRLTHQKIKRDHPDLLTQMENLVSHTAEKNEEIEQETIQKSQNKNMETVMKFLKLKQGQPAFTRVVADIIRQKSID